MADNKIVESPRPIEGLKRDASIHPALRPSVTNVPVTPDIGLATYASGTSGSGASQSYFTHNVSKLRDQMAQSPSEAAAGAKSGRDILRRMSLSFSHRKDSFLETDPSEGNPALSLSGSIISATICIPHSLSYRKGSAWELNSRRGTSALFDSFEYLSSEKTPWNHTLVGWTGEIKSGSEEGISPPDTPPHGRTSTSSKITPLNKSSAPIPVDDSVQLPPTPPASEGIWISKEDKSSLERQLAHDKTCKTVPVWLADDIEPNSGDLCLRNQARWRRFAEHELYTLFHYKQHEPTDGRAEKKSWEDYCQLNLMFANRILEIYKPGDIVMIHDYHLLLLPGVDAYGSKVSVGVFPIGIDAAGVQKLAFNQTPVDEKAAALKKLHAGKRIIVGRDRLDSVRGVAQKLMAFERFLEHYPDWHDQVVLIQVTSPTSVEDEQGDSGNKIATKVSELVAKINGMYGSLGFSPVQHYPQYLAQDEYFALLRSADVGLITSVRDGMNTTSLEYVVCQRDGHGPLILSEFSGTAGSLKDAIHINPWDLSGVAAAIDYALRMSAEKKMVQHQSLYHHVTKHNVQSWTHSCTKRLLTVLNSSNNNIATPLLDKAAMLMQYQKANKRLFMFDYDGTLTPIVKDPNAALPSERLLRTIKILAADPKNAVWIISGRDQEFLGQQLGHIAAIGFSAEHGSFLRYPNTSEWENLAETFDMSWQPEVMECFQKYTEKTQGSFIERKRCALTWHYRRADPDLGIHMARECQKELEQTVGKKWDVEVMAGKANLEVRPTFINKGEIVKRLVASYGSEVGQPPEFFLCLGDDFTDEDMFRALNGLQLPEEHLFTVTVGASSKMTLARWHLLEPSDVIWSIGLLVDEGATEADVGGTAIVDGHLRDPEWTDC